MEEQEPLSVEKLTRAYLKIRDAKAELSAEFKAREAELNSQLDSVKGALLTYCKDHGVDSVRTAAGLFTVRLRHVTGLTTGRV
jgi:flagellar basal body-associated protein FliL